MNNKNEISEVYWNEDDWDDLPVENTVCKECVKRECCNNYHVADYENECHGFQDDGFYPDYQI